MKTSLAACAVVLIAAGCQTTTPDMPEPNASQPLSLNEGEVRAAIAATSGYEFGDSRVPLSQVESYVKQAQFHDGDRAMVAAMLADVLDSGATVEAKRFALRQLYIVATDAEIQPIAWKLNDPNLADLARYALESIPGEEVDERLIAALETAPPDVKIGLINSLGRRRAYSALPALRPLRQSPNPAIAEAADYAIGRIEGFIIP